MSILTRRELMLASAATATATAGPSQKPTLCLFTKHLPHLGYKELARALKDFGFPGADLTTRPRGHVLPENVETDLPLAYEALSSEGIELPMITTGLLSRMDPAARPTLYTAAKLGIPFFKLGYYIYRDIPEFESYLAQVKTDVEGLAAIAGHAGIVGGFHNHSGAYVGSSLWDHWWVMRDTKEEEIGFYYDPCHATIEGGSAGWEIGFHRVQPRLKMVEVQPWREREVGGLLCTPVPMDHAVPAVGYRVAASGGGSFFYTGDTGGGIAKVWGDLNADLLIVETTFPNAQAEFAELTRHMTPGSLERELANISASGLDLPQVIVVHMNTRAEEEIVAELRMVAERTGASITPAYEGMLVEV